MYSKAIVGKDFNKLLENINDLYTPEEIEEIKLLYAQVSSSTIQKAELIRPVVPIREWVNSLYFLGPDYNRIYPFWKEKLIDIFDRPKERRINQIILTGAIGTGKSTFAVLVILRVIYELSCYKHISALFNLFGVSRIAFAYLSVTRQQAQNTGFALLIEWLDSIPYFREKFQRNTRLDSMAIWPEERLIITFGSVANHFIGMNLFGSILDEANFFSGRSKEDSNYKMNSKVAELYTQIITRSESRFIVNGINYSMSLLVSSSTVESSFTEERIEKAKDDPHTYIVSPSLWDVKPKNYKGKKFLVYVGGDNVDPFVVNKLDDLNMLLQLKKYNQIHDIDLMDAFELLPIDIKARILKVPIEHKLAFQGDIIIALQDLAGYSVSSANKLFSSNAAYEACLVESKFHPFSKEEIVLSTTTQPGQSGFLPIKSYLYNNFKFIDPKRPHFMHLDLALTGDSAGIAMCHISGWKSIYRQESNYEQLSDTDTGLIEDEIKIPIIEIDFMLRINPPKKPNKIPIAKIRNFIVYLRNTLGINFGLITADQFQSAQLLQELDELDFSTGYQSVDRKPDAYLGFTQLVYEHRVRLYDYLPFKRELFGVVYYPGRNKVDHTATGTKDVADAVVGATNNAIKFNDKTDMDEGSLASIFAEINTSSETAYKDAVKNTLEALLKSITGN